MNRVLVNVDKPYNVKIGCDILSICGEEILKVHKVCKVCVITDDTVNSLYGKIVLDSLKKSGFDVVVFEFKHGEASKNINVMSDALEFMAENYLTRTDLIVALGGGVVGDLAGFVAATYLRGIDFVQIPTTFLSAIDSSVGGKTAVNLKSGKNLVGAFWQPVLVICDYKTLDTLDECYFLDGIGEAIKYAMAFDKGLFELIYDNKKIKDNIEKIITRCVEIKARIVEEDEHDLGERKKLNLGHTIGHAIEKCSDFKVSHGQAVAIGTVIMSRACVKRGILSEEDFKKLVDLTNNVGLSTQCKYSVENLLESALADKKRSGDTMSIIIATSVGSCDIKNILVTELKDWIADGIN